MTIKPKRELKKRTHRFSIIEIVLALIVIVIGIIGIIGLFPLGMESQKAAVGKSFAGDAAEQFLHFNASKIDDNWYWTNVFADANPGASGVEDWGANRIVVFPSPHEGLTEEFVRAEYNPNLVILAAEGFDINDIYDGTATYDGMFKLEQQVSDTVEFTAVLRCWKELAASGESVTLFVEISWPEAKPYDAREKAVFNLDVFQAPKESKLTAAKTGCLIERENGDGYVTQISRVYDRGAGGFDIVLSISRDAEAAATMTSLVVEGDSLTATLSTAGSVDPTAVGILPSDPLLKGVRINGPTGPGADGPGAFDFEYTTPALMDQRIATITGSNENVADFRQSDFEAAMECTAAADTIICDAVSTAVTALSSADPIVVSVAAVAAGAQAAIDADIDWLTSKSAIAAAVGCDWYDAISYVSPPLDTFLQIITDALESVADEDATPATLSEVIQTEVSAAVPYGPRFNPGSGSKNSFCLKLADGTEYTRSDLKDDPNFTYQGAAVEAYFKPIAGGGTYLINAGTPIEMQSGKVYHVHGGVLDAVLVTSANPGSMGHWMIGIVSSAGATVDVYTGSGPGNPCSSASSSSSSGGSGS